MRTGRRLCRLAALVGALSLAGCGGGSPSGILGSGSRVTGLACPNVAVLEAPSELTRFVSNGSGSLKDLLFQARLDISNPYCEITEKATFVTATAKLTIARGPAEKKGELKFSFFVAVLDGQKNIILREAFPLIIQLKPSESRFEYEDDFSIQIDRKKDIDPSTYSIYGGFEMTPAELDYSRRRHG